MITVDYIRMMALYNSEMNRRIYAGAKQLTDEQRRQDRGLFWKSLGQVALNENTVASSIRSSFGAPSVSR